MPILARSFLKFRLVTTSDGSASLHADDLDERFHNPAGAYLEARQNYALPALALLESQGRLDRDDETLYLLDACFGLGYNTYAYLQALRFERHATHPKISHLKVTAIELDDEPLSLVPQILSQPCFASIKDDEQSDATPRLDLDIKQEDLRKSVQELLPNSLDLIFHDAFSPRKMQHLWTKEIFDRYFAALRPGGALFTYATANAVKGGLLAAGFTLYKTAAVGTKPPALMAYKPADADLDASFELVSIDFSKPKSLIPFKDPSLSADRQDIEKKRIEEQALLDPK